MRALEVRIRAAVLPALCAALLLGSACTQYVNLAPPEDVRRAPEEAAGRLASLQSFAFRLDYQTDVPFELGAGFAGRWQAPDREQWSGTTRRGAEQSGVRLVAAGENQFELRDGQWTRQARGYESRVIEQFANAFQGRTFTLVESLPDLRFEFLPVMPILDPTRQKKLAGRLEIDRGTGLPRRLAVEESAGVARWQVSFDRFNRAGAVATPFVAETALVLVPAGPVTRGQLDAMVRTVRARLDTLGWDARLGRAAGRLVLRLDRRPSREALAVLVGRGDVGIYEAARVAADTPGALLVGDDAAFRVTLGRRLGAGRDFLFQSELELLPEARLTLVPRDTGRLRIATGPDGLLALVLDGRVLSAAGEARPDRVEFGDVGSKETGRVLAAVGRTEPMPAAFGTR